MTIESIGKETPSEPLKVGGPDVPPPERLVTMGTRNYTKVVATDQPEFGANHIYEISAVKPVGDTEMVLTTVYFQKGPIKENGVNGIHHEDLIAIVMDRLKSFQKTKFACNENHTAFIHLGNALKCLARRTKARKERGVEGTSNV